MKLYFAPRTRSTRARWLLEELEVPYELVMLDVSKHQTKAPEHLALHPFGDVPVLVDGATVLFESLAICLYLADRFPENRLAPPPGSPERGPYLQWMAFAEVTLDPLVVEHYRNAQLPEERRANLAPQLARLKEVLQVLEDRLAGREFAVGDSFTAADIELASILHLANTLKLLEGYPKVFEYVLRHAKRPAVRRAVSA